MFLKMFWSNKRSNCFFRITSIKMSTRGYAIEITNLSPNATEKDVYDFFAFCGAIQHVEFVRYSPCNRTTLLCMLITVGSGCLDISSIQNILSVLFGKVIFKHALLGADCNEGEKNSVAYRKNSFEIVITKIFGKCFLYFLYVIILYFGRVFLRNRAGEYARTAYVTFRNPHAVETAVLLSVSSVCKSYILWL